MFFSVCFLAGCVDVDETVWINPDGSGRIKLDISVEQDEARWQGSGRQKAVEEYKDDTKEDIREQRERFLNIPSVTDIKIDQYAEDIKMHTAYTITVKEAGDIGVVFKEFSREDYPYWDITIDKQKWNSFNFTQRFIQRKTRDGVEKDILDIKLENIEDIINLPFSDDSRYYKIKLHVDRVISSNGIISKTGKSVEWIIPFDILNQTDPYRIELTAKVKAGDARVYMFIIILFVIFLMIMLVRILRHRNIFAKK